MACDAKVTAEQFDVMPANTGPGQETGPRLADLLCKLRDRRLAREAADQVGAKVAT
jgi:hypothetical protein